MKRNLLSSLFVFLSLAALSQSGDEAQKECRIKSGIGFAAATINTKNPGTDFWLQLDYKLSKTISIATEFEKYELHTTWLF